MVIPSLGRPVAFVKLILVVAGIILHYLRKKRRVILLYTVAFLELVGLRRRKDSVRHRNGGINNNNINNNVISHFD